MDAGMIQGIIGAAQSLKQQQGGLIQMGLGFLGGRKAKRELENLQSPTYTPAKSISDYYAEAKNRYGVSPYASTLYNTQIQNINRNIAQGIAGLQNRRMALGGISSIIQGQNDAMLKAAAAAEQQRDQRFSQLGAASQAMAGEERQAFNINQMMPYEKKYNLLAMKAQANNQLLNAGMQNYWGGGQAGAIYGSSLAGSGGLQGYGGRRSTDTTIPDNTMNGMSPSQMGSYLY